MRELLVSRVGSIDRLTLSPNVSFFRESFEMLQDDDFFVGAALFIGSTAASWILSVSKGKKKNKKKRPVDDDKDGEEDMYGSVKQYDRHFLIIDKENDPSVWDKKLEKGENNVAKKVAKLSSLLKVAKDEGVIGKYMITAASFYGDDTSQLGFGLSCTTVIVYPEERMFHLRNDDEMVKFSKFVISNSESGLGRWNDELINDSGFAAEKVPWKVLILVCAHKNRDALCGRIGPKLISFLRENLNNEGNKECQVLATSHIGGHRYAGTGIILPRATWFGRIKMHGKDQNGAHVVEAVLHDLERISTDGDCRMCDTMDGVEKSILRGNGNLVW